MLPELLDVSLGVCGVCGSSDNCARRAMIHSCCSNSTADALFEGFLSKHLFKKSIPDSLSWSFVGSCGGLPSAMLYMIAHSLSKLAQGRLPVAISRVTHPRDQMSAAP